jgi:hypothetical protein
MPPPYISSMRMFALALLLPVVAPAQPVVGPETRSATFQSLGPAVDAPTPALGLTRSGSGFAISWAAVTASGHSRVLFAKLDAEATTIATRELPVLDETADAYHSAIASDGNGFLVAWMEISALDPRGVVVIAHLDQDGRVVGLPRRLMTGLIAPIVYWSGADYYVGVGSSLWIVSVETSNLPRSTTVNTMIDAMTRAGSLIAFAGHLVGPYPCWFHCPPNAPAIYTARLEVLGSCSATWSFETPFPAGTTVASDGQEYLVLWPNNDATLRAFRMDSHCNNVESTDAIRIDHLFAGGPTTSNPQAAWDGTRFIVVYQSTDTEIRGATVQGSEASPPFVIANGNVRRATVIAAAPDRFLVAYEVQSASGTQLAAHFIDFPPPRRRVAK